MFNLISKRPLFRVATRQAVRHFAKKKTDTPYKTIPAIIANTYRVNKQLSAVIGVNYASFPDMISGIHKYIKKNDLVVDKGVYKVDQKLSKLLSKEDADLDEINGKHVMKLPKGNYSKDDKKILTVEELIKKYPDNHKLVEYMENKNDSDM